MINPTPPIFVQSSSRNILSRQEFVYFAKQEFSGFKYIIPILLVATFIFFSTAIANDFGILNSPWYYPLLSISAAIIIAIVVHAINSKTNQEIFYRIRKVEGLVHVKLDPENEGKDSARFHIGYALEGILYNISEIRKEVKQWGHENNKAERENIEIRCNHLWNSSLSHYAKIIIDPKIVSPLLFNSDVLSRLKIISEQCSIKLQFNEERNQSIHFGINRIIVNSLLLLDALKLNTKYKDTF